MFKVSLPCHMIILPGLSEKLMQGMLRSTVGMTDGFHVGVGLLQGSALRPLLFVVAMDKLTDEVRQEFLWTMMFVDDSDNREEAVLEMVKMSWFYWEGPGWTGLEVRPEGQLRLRCLETKLERRDGTDVCNRGHIGWRMLNMELTGRRKRGRP